MGNLLERLDNVKSLRGLVDLDRSRTYRLLGSPDARGYNVRLVSKWRNSMGIGYTFESVGFDGGGIQFNRYEINYGTAWSLVEVNQ